MIINYNVSGSDRKRLVAAIAEHTGEKAKYLGAPGFVYQVGGYHISVDGQVTIEDNSTAAALIRFLREKGFQAEDPLAECIEDDTAEEETEAGEINGVCISMPRSLFTEASLENLKGIIASKGNLIKKALGMDDLPLEITDTKVSFPWFPGIPTPEELKAYDTFICKLCEMARNQKRVVAKASFSAFDLDGYQVVRSQFLQLRYEGPVINISNERISFNKFCVQRFGDIAYIQLLLHPAERRIAIRPCKKSDAHSIRWRPDPEKPVYSKTLNCQHFGNALYSIMNWNPDYVYKIRGTWASRGMEQIIVFNLPNAVPATLLPSEGGDASKARRRVDLCPEEWDGDFGDGFYEHALENGFYYVAPNSEWNSQASSILAPGIEQFPSASPEQLQMSIENLMRGTAIEDGH